MATYLQWRKRHLQGERKSCYFLFGPERYLVEDVIRRVSGGMPSYTHHADEMEEADVWNAVMQRPFERCTHIVRTAELLEDWTHLDEWFSSRRRDDNVLVFVSGEDDREMKSPELVRIRKSGKVVKCGPYDDDQAVKLLVSLAHGALDEKTAMHLYRRVGNSIEACVDTLKKVRLFKVPVTRTLIDAITVPAYATDFMHVLLHQKKAEAMSEASSIVVPEELNRIIATLDYRVDAAAYVQRLRRKYEPTYNAVKSGKMKGMTLKEVEPVAGYYDAQGKVRPQRALAVADDAMARGIEKGVVEVMVAMW